MRSVCEELEWFFHVDDSGPADNPSRPLQEGPSSRSSHPHYRIPRLPPRWRLQGRVSQPRGRGLPGMARRRSSCGKARDRLLCESLSRDVHGLVYAYPVKQFPGKPQYHRQVHVRRTGSKAPARGKLAKIVARETQMCLVSSIIPFFARVAHGLPGALHRTSCGRATTIRSSTAMLTLCLKTLCSSMSSTCRREASSLRLVSSNTVSVVVDEVSMEGRGGGDCGLAEGSVYFNTRYSRTATR